eukprot:m.337478 g.337478  ORF g.337478 m.337478 type:complete len:114 (-) comp19804_c0_seq6:31-372(-)
MQLHVGGTVFCFALFQPFTFCINHVLGFPGRFSRQRLAQHVHVIFCPACSFRIETRGDAVTLDTLKTALAQTISEHRGHCTGKPTFSVDSQSAIDFCGLVMTCAQCDEFDIVL